MNWERIFNSSVVRVKLSGEIGFGDSVVMRREMVALVTEGADPDLGGEVDARERVEWGRTGLAAEWRVREARDVGVGADRGDGGGEWDDALAGFDFGAWPHVPCHADSVDAFWICVRHLRRHRRRRFGELGIEK